MKYEFIRAHQDQSIQCFEDVHSPECESRDFLISGAAKMVHPFSPESFPAGAVCKQGRGSSIVEVTRFELPSFTIEIQELAEWFGFELAMNLDRSVIAGTCRRAAGGARRDHPCSCSRLCLCQTRYRWRYDHACEMAHAEGYNDKEEKSKEGHQIR